MPLQPHMIDQRESGQIADLLRDVLLLDLERLDPVNAKALRQRAAQVLSSPYAR